MKVYFQFSISKPNPKFKVQFLKNPNPRIPIPSPKSKCSTSIFRYIKTTLWSKAGHLNKALSKGAKTTTWIWNLHAYGNDFDIQESSTGLIARKVFSSNLAHLSLVFFWISGMHLHGAYLSNYDIWLKDPKSITPSSHSLYSIIGQDILNSYTSQYFSGITITSGFYQLWRSEGIITQSQLKHTCAHHLTTTLICLSGSYLHMQLIPKFTSFIRFKSHPQYHLIIIFGSSSISHCGHQIHIVQPANALLDSGISTQDPYTNILQGISNLNLQRSIATTTKLLNPSTRSVFLAQVAAHHFTTGVVFIILGLIRFLTSQLSILTSYIDYHAELSINLATWASLSIIVAVRLTATPVYPYLSTDYPTVLCLFVHHT